MVSHYGRSVSLKDTEAPKLPRAQILIVFVNGGYLIKTYLNLHNITYFFEKIASSSLISFTTGSGGSSLSSSFSSTN